MKCRRGSRRRRSEEGRDGDNNAVESNKKKKSKIKKANDKIRESKGKRTITLREKKYD